ncbi:MAG: hypothetical protein HUJ30_04945, partial [Gammaproteobacteria bacterium]|nr:hypothetical protein [Gammaproteobacteria bacterium]
ARKKNRRVALVINKQVERRSTDLNTRRAEKQAAEEQQRQREAEVEIAGPSGEEVIINTDTVTPVPENQAPRRVFREANGEQ